MKPRRSRRAAAATGHVRHDRVDRPGRLGLRRGRRGGRPVGRGPGADALEGTRRRTEDRRGQPPEPRGAGAGGGPRGCGRRGGGLGGLASGALGVTRGLGQGHRDQVDGSHATRAARLGPDDDRWDHAADDRLDHGDLPGVEPARDLDAAALLDLGPPRHRLEIDRDGPACRGSGARVGRRRGRGRSGTRGLRLWVGDALATRQLSARAERARRPAAASRTRIAWSSCLT